MNTSCFLKEGEYPSMDELRMILENCGSQLRAKDFKALLDYIEHIASFSFGLWMGIANTSTDPAMDGRVGDNEWGWYFAEDSGTYSHFKDKNGNPIVVDPTERRGNLVILSFDKCDKHWVKYVYNVSAIGDLRKYEFTVIPKTITVDFAKGKVIGGGTQEITLTITSRYDGMPVAYLSEQNLPEWIEWNGLIDNRNGTYTVNLLVHENFGDYRCNDIQFVQFGSNLISTVKLCQNYNPVWMYKFLIEGEEYHKDTFYKEYTNRVYNVTSTKHDEFIEYAMNNQLPSWYTLTHYNKFLFLTINENTTGVNRQYYSEFKQNESKKLVTLDITQYHTENPNKYIFSVNGKTEELAEFDLQPNSKIFTVVSTKNGNSINYSLLSDLPDWIKLVYGTGTVRVEVFKNNTDASRETKLVFVQAESSKFIVINVTQSDTCDITIEDCIFNVGGEKNPIITRPGGNSELDINVTSTRGGSLVGFSIENYNSLPDWAFVTVTVDKINLILLENHTEQDRGFTIALKQDSPCGETMTINIVQKDYVPSQICPGQFEAGGQIAYQTTRIILGERAGDVRFLLGTYFQADSFDIYYGHDLIPSNLIWSTKSLPTADPVTGLVSTTAIRENNYNNGKYKGYAICDNEEIHGNNQEFMYEIAVTIPYNPIIPGIDYVTLVTQAPEFGTAWAYRMGCPCHEGNEPSPEWDYCQSCGTIGIYYNEEMCEEVTKNDCDNESQLPSTETVCVQSGRFTSEESQDDADAKARTWFNLNKQGLANEQGYCVDKAKYWNTKQCDFATKEGCPEGTYPDTVEYCVNANSVFSYMSVTDANAKAMEQVQANKQAYANANGECNLITVYYSDEYCDTFIKEDCPPGSVGEVTPFCAIEKQFTSTISKDHANDQAQNYVETEGQDYVNEHGECIEDTIYYNTRQCGIFFKDDCGEDSFPKPYEYCVEAGEEVSNDSQNDADAKANARVRVEGPEAANEFGECEEINRNPIWKATGNTNCSTSETENEGQDGLYAFKEEKDTNEDSLTYNDTRWIRAEELDGACLGNADPIWQDLEIVCSCTGDSVINEDVGDGAYAFKVQKDINKQSPTYEQTRTIRAAENDSECPKSPGTWIAGQGNEEFVCDGVDKYRQEFLWVCNVKTSTTRLGELVEANAVDCGGKCDPVWESTNNTRCIKEAGLNTGELEHEEMDIAGCSETYGDTRWVSDGMQTATCPLPFGNTKQCGTANKQCDTGYTGSPVEYCVNANTYYSDTQVGANVMAQQDVENNKQAYANANGTCNNTTPKWTDTGNTRCNGCTSQKEQRDTNTYSSTYNTTKWVSGGNLNCDYCRADYYEYRCSNCVEQRRIHYTCDCSSDYFGNWATYSSGSSCNTSPSWSSSGYSPYCTTTGGYCVINQKDTNPCSSTYNQVKSVGSTGCPTTSWSNSGSPYCVGTTCKQDQTRTVNCKTETQTINGSGCSPSCDPTYCNTAQTSTKSQTNCSYCYSSPGTKSYTVAAGKHCGYSTQAAANAAAKSEADTEAQKLANAQTCFTDHRLYISANNSKWQNTIDAGALNIHIYRDKKTESQITGNISGYVEYKYSYETTWKSKHFVIGPNENWSNFQLGPTCALCSNGCTSNSSGSCYVDTRLVNITYTPSSGGCPELNVHPDSVRIYYTHY